MDTLVGFHVEGGGVTGAPNVQLNLAHFRQSISDMETALDAHQPLLVFDNHDNTRSWDRFGDGGPHNPQIARIIATILFTTRSTALMYYGEELGMSTHTPAHKEDVRDPIGITGWPKEKGRDGERTPMQWTPSPPAAGFSTTAQTWLPVGDDYPNVNVVTETAGPNSLLNWYRTLTTIRRANPTVHDGGIVMLDTQNPSVLSYARTAPAGGHPIVVSLNFTAQPQTVHLDLTAAGITSTAARALLFDAAPLNSLTTLTTFTLPPYASLVAEVQ
jgi:alpha-glucosidase